MSELERSTIELEPSVRYNPDLRTAVRACPLLTGDESRAAEVRDVEFPRLLDPVDDQPPTTVITRIERIADGKVRVNGVASDDGAVKTVIVNGRPATATTEEPARSACWRTRTCRRPSSTW